MWDAAFPPASPPKWEAVAGYIGGNTPHVWTDQEWARQQARWRLPIFTRSHDGDPSADAAHAIRWMTAHHVPKGVCVALDFETRVDATYLHAFDGVDEFKQAVRAAMGLREGEAAASDSDVRVILRGDPTHPDNLNSIHADTAAILQAVQTAADPAAMAALLAGQLKVTGISTAPGGVVTVTFAP